jgi:branched-chain amino acid transport system permease protein
VKAVRHIPRLLAVVMLVLVLAPLGAAVAQDEGSAIKGTLEAIDGQDRVPVAGVTISVAQDGTDIGSAVTDESGEWLVVVPGAGAYQVTLDVSTLPDGVGPTDPEGTTLPEVTVREGQQKTVRFQLGPGSVSGVSAIERFVDLVVLGLKLGAIIAIAAIGLSLIYGVTGLVNFSHGEMVALGAVIAFFFHVSVLGPQWPLWIAAVPAILLGAGLGGAQEVWLWRPLRRRGTGLIAMMVISIGLSFALRNLILILIKGEPRPFVDYAVQSEVEFLGISTVPKNIVIILASVAILVLVGLFLERTKMGTAMRAVADNKDLAESSGINVDGVILTTWLLGGGLAAIGGIFLGVSEQIQFDMGFRLLLLIFAAVVLGGLGSAYGAMVGGFIVGLVVEVSTFWFDSEFKTAIGLGVLILMLLLRPQGILGSRERIG